MIHVIHLRGPQGVGKSRLAQVIVAGYRAEGKRAVHLDADDLAREFGNSVQRALTFLRPVDVVVMESQHANAPAVGTGDLILDFSVGAQ